LSVPDDDDEDAGIEGIPGTGVEVSKAIAGLGNLFATGEKWP
jgi:hypothetical protein